MDRRQPDPHHNLRKVVGTANTFIARFDSSREDHHEYIYMVRLRSKSEPFAVLAQAGRAPAFMLEDTGSNPCIWRDADNLINDKR